MVYHTSNGGATWVKMHWPFLPHFVTAPNEQDWWAISYTHNISRPYLYHTQDGGVHWKRYQVSGWNSDTYLLGINFVTPQFGYILGNPTLLITRDGGRRWTALNFPSTLNPTAVSFVNPATGWLTTGNNVLYRTTNGGITWQPMVN